MAPDTWNAVAGGIASIALLTAVTFLIGIHRFARQQVRSTTLLTIAWLATWAVLASQGLLARFEQRPPPLLGMFVATFAGGFMLGLSSLGGVLARSVPLWALVLFQGFRLPLELCMHEAARQGIMPPELSIEGYNFDFLTGATALPVAFALHQGAPEWLALAWNCLGSLCLAVIAVVALASSPMIQAFGPDHVNTWVAYFPYVWLPTVLVLLAIAGQIIVFRCLSRPGGTLRPARVLGAH